MFWALWDINGLCNEHEPLPKNVTVSDCSTVSHVRPCKNRISIGVDTLLHLFLLPCQHSFTFPKLGKAGKENECFEYVDRYIYKPFLNSQSTPWIKVSCRQSGKAEKPTRKVPHVCSPCQPDTQCPPHWPQPSPSSSTPFSSPAD